MNISNIGEFGLIARIASTFGCLVPEGCSGIGDDCAIIPLSQEQSMVITTDMLVEDTHFLRDEITPYELGYKSLAVNLSDVAAMGATAHSSFLSIALPGDITTEWCDRFFEGYRSHNISLLGGDTTKSAAKIVINVTAIGLVDNANIKLRSGAKVGDKIYVTSTLGDSAGGLRAILEGVRADYPELVRTHNLPRPHMDEGQQLGTQPQVHSMMDVSDGIASDLRHILKASGVGAEIELNRIPISEHLNASPWNALELALTAGEDYCLLFTASAGFKTDFHEIGIITATNIAEITYTENGIKTSSDYHGFTHF